MIMIYETHIVRIIKIAIRDQPNKPIQYTAPEWSAADGSEEGRGNPISHN